MNLHSGLSAKAADQEREMTEALLSFAKYAIQNAQAHLSTVELTEAVKLLQQVEQLIEDRLIELSPPIEPGLAQPEADEMDLRDL
jgi:vacuolar-type H+-ATPase subunit E/Vma4